MNNGRVNRFMKKFLSNCLENGLLLLGLGMIFYITGGNFFLMILIILGILLIISLY
jgi:hypothetical protein